MSSPTPPLHTRAFVQAHLYKDSVALMRVAERLLARPEVVNATLQLGNAANKEILEEAGLLTAEVRDAGPSDIMVVVQARSAAAAEAAAAAARAELAGQGPRVNGAGSAGGEAGEGGADHGGREPVPATTLAMGLARMPGANLAQISVPGPYAAAEALKAVRLGLNVFLFSDNVPLADEVRLKREAARRGVLVMGPDCGTAIIGGVPLGFANNVRRGAIGLVAASGTGLQEVTTQIHRMGGGISHAIGTGGRDIKAEVGAATLLQGIELLARDEGTKVIAVLSKPPAPQVAARVLQALRATGKPAVVLFIGAEAAPAGKTSGAAAAPAPVSVGLATLGVPLRQVHTLVDCAAAAIELTGQQPQWSNAEYTLLPPPRFVPGQRNLRALFSGGTYAAEALALWARAGLQVWSNVPLDDRLALADPRRTSMGHTALDLGDDAFTVARPHPMIDPGARIERLLQEAADPTVRVILLDVVLGWGAHADPAGELKPALLQARQLARRDGRSLGLVAFVCGTELDPQGLERQEKALIEAGVVLAGNSANAAWLAARWLGK